ncbi:MAG: hypothetical protein E7294_13440 [Lachnospiraceae bacterium]|jgi:hypothetical protein|nr:hypothetical protein [Lachnospiraceae bacterium]
MEEILKNKIKRNLLSIWIILGIVLLVPVGVFYLADDIHIVAICLPEKRITAGEDLSKYECRKVSCTFRYVARHVVSLYDQDDPEKVLYTCGYMVLDDQLQNPFCVFLPIDEAERMENMAGKTWSVMNGGRELISSVEVNGYVWKLSGKNAEYYNEALKAVYGEKAVPVDEVYYIDDRDAVKGKNEMDSIRFVCYAIIILLLGFLGYLVVISITAFRFPQVIEEFLSQTKMSRLELEKEFLNAKDIDGVIWLTPDLTVYLNNTRIGILKNRDIVWAYIKRVHNGKNTFYELRLFCVDKKMCAKVITGPNRQQILEYYQAYCPHIVIGEDRMKKRLFKQDFNGFLQLQYYRYANRQTDSYSGFDRYYGMSGNGYRDPLYDTGSDLSGYRDPLYEDGSDLSGYRDPL